MGPRVSGDKKKNSLILPGIEPWSTNLIHHFIDPDYQL
jgi:hypothetical protein